MAWRSFLPCFSFPGGASCGREAPPAEPPNEAEIAVPVAAQPARRGSLRAIIRTTGVVTPAAGSEFMATAPGAGAHRGDPAGGRRPRRARRRPRALRRAVRRGRGGPASGRHRARAGAARKRARRADARAGAGRARHHLAAGNGERDREVADAQAELARAEAARRASEAAAARAIVRAPFAGVIAQRMHNPGDVVQGIATDPISGWSIRTAWR